LEFGGEQREKAVAAGRGKDPPETETGDMNTLERVELKNVTASILRVGTNATPKKSDPKEGMGFLIRRF